MTQTRTRKPDWLGYFVEQKSINTPLVDGHIALVDKETEEVVEELPFETMVPDDFVIPEGMILKGHFVSARFRPTTEGRTGGDELERELRNSRRDNPGGVYCGTSFTEGGVIYIYTRMHETDDSLVRIELSTSKTAEFNLAVIKLQAW